MDWLTFLLEVHFASPFFMAEGAVLFLVLYVFFVRAGRSPIEHSYLGFFHKAVTKKGRNLLLWIYRTLPYLVALTLVLAIGNPVHEEYETRTRKMVPYCIYLDSSGSLASHNAQGKPSLDFKDSILNTARLSLMKFVEEKKDTSEFCLMLYSDTPYAARYFVGGGEAQVQIGEFLETLPQEIEKWQGTSQAFYLKGTNTAFALEAAMRYRVSLPASLRESVFILITDLEDTQIWRVAKNIDALLESGPKRGVYVIALSSTGNDRNVVSFEKALKHKDSVRIFRARAQASLDLALRTIGEAENFPGDPSREVLRSESFQLHLTLAAIFLALVYVGIGEFHIRRIP